VNLIEALTARPEGRDPGDGQAYHRCQEHLLLDSTAGDTGAGSAPTDMALTERSRFLYALDSRTASISAFRVRRDGALERSFASSLPTTGSSCEIESKTAADQARAEYLRLVIMFTTQRAGQSAHPLGSV
jgi:hypothetical protein